MTQAKNAPPTWLLLRLKERRPWNEPWKPRAHIVCFRAVAQLIEETVQPQRVIGSKSLKYILGYLGGSVVEHLPLAPGVIRGLGIESHIRLPVKSLLLPLSMSLPLSVCLS